MKLKPCPFCGGQAKLLTHKELSTTYYGVHCEITGCCSISTLYLSEEQAIEAWNRREPMDRIVEQLIANSGIVEDGDGHAGHVIFTEKAIEIVKKGSPT